MMKNINARTMKVKEDLEFPLMFNGQLPSKPTSRLRWTVLALSCLMMLGSYYCFDIPSAIKTQIGDYMNTSAESYENYFALLYSLYAIPNIILPFFGGYFVDTFGCCLSLLVSTGLLALGQCVVSMGLLFKSWDVILSGRFIFALGGETLIVASSALLADWFIGKELAFAFGVNLALARVGSVINNYCSVYFASTVSVVFANWVGAIICGVSVASVLITMPIDRGFNLRISEAKATLAEEQVGSRDDYGSMERAADRHSSAGTASALTTKISGEIHSGGDLTTTKNSVWEDFKAFPKIFWVLIGITVLTYGIVVPFNNVASSLLLERSYFTAAPCQLKSNGCQSDTNQPTCVIDSTQAPPLPIDVTIGGTYYPGQVPSADVNCDSTTWTQGCTATYCSALNNAEQTVSVIMSIPYIISGAASPFFGILVDYYGNRATLTLLSSVVLLAVHASFAWSKNSPVGPLVGQGIAYTAFAAVLWPAIPLLVSEELRGLSFGIGTASYNAGCAVVPLLAASIYTHSGNLYIPNVEILFFVMAGMAFILGLVLNYMDYKYNDGVLNRGLVNEQKENPVQDEGHETRDHVYSAVHTLDGDDYKEK